MYLNGFGWFDPAGVAGTAGPTEQVGESFFVQNPGADTNWVHTFFFQFAAGAPQGASIASGTERLNSPSASSAGPEAPPMVGIAVTKSEVTLRLANPRGVAYKVQFSDDGVSWRTVATKQNGGSWSGPYPGGQRGFYRLMKL